MRLRIFAFLLAVLIATAGQIESQTRGQVGSTASDQALRKLISPRGFTRWPPFPSDPHACTLLEQGDFYVNTTTAMLRFCDGTDWQDIAVASGIITGSGTAGFIPRWSSAAILGDSSLSDNGIGTVTRTGNLSIQATADLELLTTLGYLNLQAGEDVDVAAGTNATISGSNLVAFQTGSSGRIEAQARFAYTTGNPFTIPDGAGRSVGTYTPDMSYVRLVCNDADTGCEAHLSETGAMEGQRLSVSLFTLVAGDVTWPDEAGVLAGTNPIMTAVNDTIEFLYEGSIWQMTGFKANTGGEGPSSIGTANTYQKVNAGGTDLTDGRLTDDGTDISLEDGSQFIIGDGDTTENNVTFGPSAFTHIYADGDDDLIFDHTSNASFLFEIGGDIRLDVAPGQVSLTPGTSSEAGNFRSISRPVAGASGNLLNFSVELNAMDAVGGDVVNVFNFGVTNGVHTGGELNILNFPAIAGSAATENALNIDSTGTSYDNAINFVGVSSIRQNDNVNWNLSANRSVRFLDVADIRFMVHEDEPFGQSQGLTVAVVGASQTISARNNFARLSAVATASILTISAAFDAIAPMIIYIFDDSNITILDSDAGGAANTVDLKGTAQDFAAQAGDMLVLQSLRVPSAGNLRWVELARMTPKTVEQPESVTCADSGDGSPGTLTITPDAANIQITNADADGCDVTMAETTAVDGEDVGMIVVSNAGLTVDFSDTSGVTELAGPFSAGLWDSIDLRYMGDRWVERSRSDN